MPFKPKPATLSESLDILKDFGKGLLKVEDQAPVKVAQELGTPGHEHEYDPHSRFAPLENWREKPAGKDMELALWERNEGKRLIRALQAEGATPGHEHEFLCNLIERRERGFAAISLHGRVAPEVVNRIVANIQGPRFKRGVSSGAILFGTLVYDGATPGSSKKWLNQLVARVKQYDSELRWIADRRVNPPAGAAHPRVDK